jgi:hypothetical protein
MVREGCAEVFDFALKFFDESFGALERTSVADRFHDTAQRGQTISSDTGGATLELMRRVRESAGISSGCGGAYRGNTIGQHPEKSRAQFAHQIAPTSLGKRTQIGQHILIEARNRFR